MAVFAPRKAVGPVQESGDLGGGMGRSREDAVALQHLCLSLKLLDLQLQVRTETGLVGDVKVEVDRPPGATPFGPG